MRTEKPLWERVYLGSWGPAYVNAGKIIGHLGCSALVFYDAAKLLPGYDKHRYECAVRALTVYAKRERGEYELDATAKKVLRVIIGPPPGDPEYRRWWESRLVSVRQMKEWGQAVEWAEAPRCRWSLTVPRGGEGKPKARKPAASKKQAARK